MNSPTTPPPPSPDDSFLRQLATSNIPCPACGHNLHGATSGRCTECGGVVTLDSIAKAGARAIAPLPWFIATAAAGLHLVSSFDRYRDLRWGLWYQNSSIRSPAFHAVMKTLSVGFWLLIPVAVLFLIGAQGWFARLPRDRQWLIAAGFIALALVTHRRWYLHWF